MYICYVLKNASSSSREEKPCRKAKMSMLLNRDTRSPMSSSREVTSVLADHTEHHRKQLIARSKPQ